MKCCKLVGHHWIWVGASNNGFYDYDKFECARCGLRAELERKPEPEPKAEVFRGEGKS